MQGSAAFGLFGSFLNLDLLFDECDPQRAICFDSAFPRRVEEKKAVQHCHLATVLPIYTIIFVRMQGVFFVQELSLMPQGQDCFRITVSHSGSSSKGCSDIIAPADPWRLCLYMSTQQPHNLPETPVREDHLSALMRLHGFGCTLFTIANPPQGEDP